MQSWIGGDSVPSDLDACITSSFSHVIVHGLRPKAFHNHTVAALSQGRLRSIESIGGTSQYEIERDSQDICGPFAGLTLGPANSTNDYVLSGSASDSSVRRFISIDGRPFMSGVRQKASEVLFLASEDVADLDAEVGDTPLSAYFSRLLPHAMALRVIGEESWRPSGTTRGGYHRRSASATELRIPELRSPAASHDPAQVPHNNSLHTAQLSKELTEHNATFRENTGNFGILFSWKIIIRSR